MASMHVGLTLDSSSESGHSSPSLHSRQTHSYRPLHRSHPHSQPQPHSHHRPSHQPPSAARNHHQHRTLPPQSAPLPTFTSRFEPIPKFLSSDTRLSGSRRPISPPPLRRPVVDNIPDEIICSTPASAPVPAPAQALLHGARPQPKPEPVQPIINSIENASDMARLHSAGVSNFVPRQSTPSSDSRHVQARPQPKPTPLITQTPRKNEWDVPRITRALKGFFQDIRKGHAQMTSYIIETTKATESRIHTGNDLFAGLSSKPVPAKKGETMRIKFKVSCVANRMPMIPLTMDLGTH